MQLYQDAFLFENETFYYNIFSRSNAYSFFEKSNSQTFMNSNIQMLLGHTFLHMPTCVEGFVKRITFSLFVFRNIFVYLFAFILIDSVKNKNEFDLRIDSMQ
jgi:hypothetical protein